MAVPPTVLQATLSGEIYLKTRAVRQRFAEATCANAEAALGPGVSAREVSRGRIQVDGVGDVDEAAERLSRVFGIQAVEELVWLPFPDLERGTAIAAELAAPMVEGRRFAVRCKRVGSQAYRSHHVERELGSRLLPRSAGVDLDHPEVTVRIRVVEDEAWLTRRRWQGPAGLPLGVQGRALVLLSGGFDSAVAAHQLLRRGVEVTFLHFELSCDQRDQALAVAHQLWSTWGAGTEGTVHVLDFGPLRDEIVDRIEPRFRQVVLKRLMLSAADHVAEEAGIDVVATGEAIGQVSSQTFVHLAALDRLSERPVLRPLLTFSKQEIISEARRIGVAELSERAGEACDLAEGHRVETAVPTRLLSRLSDQIPAEAVEAALGEWRVHDLATWLPGDPGRRRAA